MWAARDARICRRRPELRRQSCVDGTSTNIIPILTTRDTIIPSNLRRPLLLVSILATSLCTTIPFDLGNYYGNDASSTYNAFEVMVEKRLRTACSSSLTTPSPTPTATTATTTPIDHGIAWGPVDFARNQVLVINTVYELPFGKGKKYMGDASRAMDYVVGGWQLSNTTNWSSGLPWTPSFAECGGEEDVNVCRPNMAPDRSRWVSGSLHTPPGGQPYIQYFTPVTDNYTTSGGPFLDPGKGNSGTTRVTVSWTRGLLL